MIGHSTKRVSHLPPVFTAVFWFVVVLTNLTLYGFGQVSAAISGAARDPSGGALPGVSITIRNVETNVARHTVADSVGEYQVWALPVGDYEMVAEKSGFRSVVRKGLHLDVRQQAVVDFVLPVGVTRQQVTITGEAPMVSANPDQTSGLVGKNKLRICLSTAAAMTDC